MKSVVHREQLKVKSGWYGPWLDETFPSWLDGAGVSFDTHYHHVQQVNQALPLVLPLFLLVLIWITFAVGLYFYYPMASQPILLALVVGWSVGWLSYMGYIQWRVYRLKVWLNRQGKEWLKDHPLVLYSFYLETQWLVGLRGQLTLMRFKPSFDPASRNPASQNPVSTIYQSTASRNPISTIHPAFQNPLSLKIYPESPGSPAPSSAASTLHSW